MLFLSTGELAILDFVQEHLRCEFLDWLLPKITLLANAGIFWILLTIFLLCFRRCRTWGVEMAFALLACLLLGNLLLKPWIARVRPYDVNTTVQLLLKPPTDYSFPSGHTYSSFAAATVLMFHKKSWGLAALALAALIAFSRIYLYIHYPTDVLAGLIMGVLLGCAAHFAVQKWLAARANRYKI